MQPSPLRFTENFTLTHNCSCCSDSGKRCSVWPFIHENELKGEFSTQLNETASPLQSRPAPAHQLNNSGFRSVRLDLLW